MFETTNKKIAIEFVGSSTYLKLALLSFSSCWSSRHHPCLQRSLLGLRSLQVSGVINNYIICIQNKFVLSFFEHGTVSQYDNKPLFGYFPVMVLSECKMPHNLTIWRSVTSRSHFWFRRSSLFHVQFGQQEYDWYHPPGHLLVFVSYCIHEAPPVVRSKQQLSLKSDTTICISSLYAWNLFRVWSGEVNWDRHQIIICHLMLALGLESMKAC